MTSPFERFLNALEAHGQRVRRNGNTKATAQCPAHDDAHASLSIGEGDDRRVLVQCWAGCRVEDVVAAVGLEMPDMFEQKGGGVVIPFDRRAHLHTSKGCTLEAYAEHKRLPVEFLRGLGISHFKHSTYGTHVLRIPYQDRDGKASAVRLRLALDKGDGPRFLWKKGSKPLLYGVWREQCASVQADRDGGGPLPTCMAIVEGESDCHTLWHHGIPALGLPGATGWNEHRDAEHFNGIDRIFVVIEPDRGGEAVEGWVAHSRIRDRVWLVDLGEHKDPSGLHLADPERFLERWNEALENAEPWRERAAQVEDTERREVADQCADLAASPRILDVFAADLHRLGIVGEERLAQLVFLSATSRLSSQIVSVGVKGPSAAGKSVTVQHTLRFFPPSAFYVLTAMSERGLIFTDEDMAHRMLVIYEAEGMAGDLQTYLVRSLLSEGQIRYQTTTRGEGGDIVGRVVELEGPTGLIVTTTAVSLHPENETRLLSVTATDTPAQTKAVMLAIAEERDDDLDLARWHALQRWLELGGRRVTIPYAATLAQEIPPVAVRLRRDFKAVLGLVRAHALLHQAQRERDSSRRIVASIEDYAVVRDLVVDLVSEGVQATVKPEVRETVEVVRKLAGEDGVTRKRVADELGLDGSAAGRRLQAAGHAGYLRNLGKGNRSAWVLGEPLPSDLEVLPAPERLELPDGWTDEELQVLADRERSS